MIDLQKQTSQHQKSFSTLTQHENHLNSRPKGHSSLASILPPPRPSHLPLGGPRIIEFLGFRTGRNQFGRNTISFDFIDLNSQQTISRTVNIDQHLSDRSYFVKFTNQLVGDPHKFKEAAKGGGEALGTLINEQRGKKYTADCEPSKSGMHTNIIDLRPLEAPRIDPKGRTRSTTRFPVRVGETTPPRAVLEVRGCKAVGCLYEQKSKWPRTDSYSGADRGRKFVLQWEQTTGGRNTNKLIGMITCPDSQRK